MRRRTSPADRAQRETNGRKPLRRTAPSRVASPPQVRGATAKRTAVSFRNLMAARSAEERLALLRAGKIPAREIQEASDELDIPATTLAGALGIPRSTLHQWTTENAPLPGAFAEATMRLAEFAQLSREAFGDADLGAQWLATRNAALAGERPLDLLGSSYGSEIVRRAPRNDRIRRRCLSDAAVAAYAAHSRA